MVLVDSSVWVDFFNGNDTREAIRLDSILGAEPVAIGDLILLEVLQGFRSDTDFESASELLSGLTIYDLLGQQLAFTAAQNYRSLRGRGITVRKSADTIIATFCIVHGIPLLYSDRDFEPFVEHLGLRAA
jgi:predicted nucleic acid-binding protein